MAWQIRIRGLQAVALARTLHFVQQDDSADGDTRSNAKITTSGSWPFVERRRQGRVDYTNRRLIAVLRGQTARKYNPARPGEREAAANSSTWPLIFLVVLAVALWAVVGLLVLWLL